jgi:glycosyltransferase involved in cell wall biosynthesis
MTFAVITYAPIIYKKGKPYAYAPYVKEMNLWNRHAEKVIYCCPESKTEGNLLIAPFEDKQNFEHIRVALFHAVGLMAKLKSALVLLPTFLTVCKVMRRADHIHLRCPGNVSLIGCFAQIFFPRKLKTCKYAGNWDWNSQQPWSYRLQQHILRNTFFTRNMQVLVYGTWPDKNRNILPFFTASYSKNEITDTPPRNLYPIVRLMYVGSFDPNKAPLTSIKVCQALLKLQYPVQLHMYGDGAEKIRCEAYVQENKLEAKVIFHGNQPAPVVKQAFCQSHFLVFISRSEGWPKVVAESMFWGCVPITTAVSCVPEMVGNGSRGTLVTNNESEIVEAIEKYLQDEPAYRKASINGMQWSRQFTLEKFENDIKKLLHANH